MSMIAPRFLDSIAGQVFTLYFAPATPARGAVLYLPPLTEEMNRCRALAAAQARAFADAGYACLLLDYFGTGDSAGELQDATWDTWRADVLTAADWLEQNTGLPVTLWGCRLGALLAADVANHAPARFRHLVWWQPVADGKLYLTQFLRLRVAFLMDRGLPAETTEQMRAQLAAGNNVVVSGYALPGGIANAIDQLRITDCTNLTVCRIDWLENVSEPGKPLALPSQKTIEALRAQGNQVNAHPFTAPPIWQLHERDEAPDLLEKTTALFRSAP